MEHKKITTHRFQRSEGLWNKNFHSCQDFVVNLLQQTSPEWNGIGAFAVAYGDGNAGVAILNQRGVPLFDCSVREFVGSIHLFICFFAASLGTVFNCNCTSH